MVSADADDDAGVAGVVHAVHEALALGAFDVANVGIDVGGVGDGEAGGGLAGFGIRADVLEARHVYPESAAAEAFF